MANIKLITIDMDGTLLSSQQQVPTGNMTAIKQALSQGIKVVIASGRPLSGILPWLKIIGVPISNDQFVIAFNGAVIQTTSGKLISKNTISYADYLQLQTFADEQKAYFQIESLDATHTIGKLIPKEAQMENYLINAALKVHDQMPKEVEFIKPLINGSQEELDHLTAIMPKELLEKFNIVRGAWYNLEFMSKNASKGNALKQIADQLAIPSKQTMAIGDQQNDLSMFQRAGIAVAMANARPEIQAKADFVTKNNDQAGVGFAIAKYALNASRTMNQPIKSN
ncbi:HAD family phosphatase [Oenococcus sicerae]|uniref:HAD family phosphatase n=1 Tax=Oenococcus sicerae TaxID=2203724 RepID=A0AAJ1RBW3_9LACO|nr:Cof-type HAD-IIB family hydrolase [Oenococcus sicerae]MDN6900060.1 HAD family phosphatase [Oenococcus sicerae]QAS69669.1 HAD family phosphatase [Oenococcus sicerae]